MPFNRFSEAEIHQTNLIIAKNNLKDRPLVKGFTIDSEESKDLDDAIWVETHGDEGLIQVHIADPTEFIEPGSPLDKGVKKRLYTLYLARGTVPMIPRSLSEDKLSLLEGMPKYALTVEIRVKSTGEVIKADIYESIFVSLGKLSYTQTEQISKDSEHPLFLPIQQAEMWAKIFNKQRVKQGALTGIIKGNFYIDEDGTPISVGCTGQILVSEYMILANTVVAKWLLDRNLEALYRNHLPQSDKIDGDTEEYSQEFLGEESIRNALNHCLAKATYGVNCNGHFALATPHYLHFTSPLRRAADFIVHRIVKAQLNDRPSPISSQELLVLSESINEYNQTQKEKQSKYYKNKKDSRLLRTSNYSDLEPKEFSRLLELSIKKDNIEPIKEEIELRLSTKSLTNSDISLLLFRGNDEELKKAIEKQIDPKHIVNLFGNLPKILKEIQDLYYEDKGTIIDRKFFINRLFLIIDNRTLTTLYQARGSSKKDAKSQATSLWLDAYLNKELVSPEDMLELDPEEELAVSNPEESTGDTSNKMTHERPLETLNNYCNSHNLPKPIREYSKQDDLFLCIISVNDISASGIASKKKVASAMAADKLIPLLLAENRGGLFDYEEKLLDYEYELMHEDDEIIDYEDEEIDSEE